MEILHINVEELVWKPAGQEVLGSENGVHYTTSDLQDCVPYVTLTLQNLDMII